MEMKNDSFGCSLVLGVALLVLLIGFLLTGCMTPRKVDKYLSGHGFYFANKCAVSFPVVDSAGTPSISYHPANNVDHTAQLDSLKTAFDQQLQAFRDAQAKEAQDTPCVATIRDLQNQYEDLQAQYLDLKARYRPCKPDTARIEIPVYHDTNPAKTAALGLIITRQRIDSVKAGAALQLAQGKAERRGKLMWGTWIILVLLGGGYLFLKSRTALLTGIIDKLKSKL